jgi:hypothetical protein
MSVTSSAARPHVAYPHDLAAVFGAALLSLVEHLPVS